MGKVIIGIHGLRNKPELGQLKQWWKKAILEGLQAQGSSISDFKFELVYWAHFLYKSPLHQDEDFKFDDRFNLYPYRELGSVPPEYKDSLIDELRRFVGNSLDNALDFLSTELDVTKVSDAVLTELFKEMSLYYSFFQDDKSKVTMVPDGNGNKKPMLRALRDILKTSLLSHQDDEIMLLAHSMGTIISYDVLRELEEEVPEFKIQHYITFGSPLGLYFVKSRIHEQWDDIRTPANITEKWRNYSDKQDKVAALDTHLSDDYGRNDRGIRVEDDIVFNSYRKPCDEELDHHSEWGYLRTPEISRQFIEFLRGK